MDSIGFSRAFILSSFAIIFASFYQFCKADVCPNNLHCAGHCCATHQNEYFCCPIDQRFPDENDRIYLVGFSSWWKDYWGVFVGCLVAGIILSVILSVLCCLFCNGCWWRTRRGGGAVGGAFPLGAIVYSPYPPPWYEESSGSGVSAEERQSRVRFNDDVSYHKK